MSFAELVAAIQPLDRKEIQEIQNRIDLKTKPPGSLGALEELALSIALIQDSDTLEIRKPCMLVFAGDHGVAKHGVSIAGSEVTQQMVLNFLNGGAAINAFCKANSMEMKVIDAGIKFPVDDTPDLISQSAGLGTDDISETSAMSEDQLDLCLQQGAEIVEKQITAGSNLIGFGEMGIGNTTSAAAVAGTLLTLKAEDIVGRGTGIDDDQFALKTRLVNKALSRAQVSQPKDALKELGGFEIAQICGGILAAAKNKTAVLIDGFIVTAAALAACRIAPACRDYLLFAHHSMENGHARLLEELKATPLLDLGLRLGEGSGAALALPLLRSACAFYNEMATFESANVTV
ncbi:MAG: nicotinate-nucleotide--dimethylbenzimidazole phosphoribosyltransferase [Sneathiellales bacterium]|nr:nicotinate-nucleotide--dimethylbenzimidazole phosphoribosyltransferase [Sneathiellales bacterium]